MIDPASARLADAKAREEALDTSRSILVQAPAGSGKTELLTMRFLKLLAEVEEPEQILAITFTRPATAEMRHRVLGKLEAAKRFSESGVIPENENLASLLIARDAYENSLRRGWKLLEQPRNLNIQTIDSLCLRLARQMPLSAGPGSTLQPTDDAEFFYQKAARRTMDRLGGENEELNDALKALLQLRDTRLADCEVLLAKMLANRDQWMHVFPLEGEADWQLARDRLEAPLHRENARVLADLHQQLSSHPELVRELLELVQFACDNLEPGDELRCLDGLNALPPPFPDFVAHWACVCDLLLTQAGDPRRSFNARNGFPPSDRPRKQRMSTVVQEIAGIPGLTELVAEIRAVPPPRYTDPQWQTLRHIFVALRYAVRELERVFAADGAVDFVEIGIAALRVLNGNTADRAFADGVRHILVDEFQDTSRRQHELLASILREWKPTQDSATNRTFFLVGDPMQSIYMFRQADVELFELVREQGFAAGGQHLPARLLQLNTNFRSTAGVVRPLNEMFSIVFPHGSRAGAAPVRFLPGVPENPADPQAAYQVHTNFFVPDAARAAAAAQNFETPRAADRQSEAEDVIEIIRHHLPRIERARKKDEEFTVAILCRARNHVIEIAAGLRGAGIPFRAVEIERLTERQEVLDLQSLTRALLHPMDRIAWLAVLRAPWCGLKLRDLHLLCGVDPRPADGGMVLRQIEEHLHLLADEPRARVSRVVSVLQSAIGNRHRTPSFSAWIERTWQSLGGPACVDAAGVENARAYFRMLERASPDGVSAAGDTLQRQLDRLQATPDPSVGERCGVQLMTIHKAKGLGFNVVLLPGLHRVTRRTAPPLVRYLERRTPSGPELLVAPIDRVGESTSPLNKWVRGLKDQREAEERKRLLYVACTRAREELHLFATATVANSALAAPPGDTLLQTAWPALEAVFAERYDDQLPAQLHLPVSGVLQFPDPDELQAPRPGVLDALAAQAATEFRRLPSSWRPAIAARNVTVSATNTASGSPQAVIDTSRPRGSRSSRTLGTIVHALFEGATRLFETGASQQNVRAALGGFRSRAVALARNDGLPPADAESCARLALGALEKALADDHGLWILKPHRESQVESSWTGATDGGAVQTLRIDRSFRAGTHPLEAGDDCLWIIDYKTATHGQSGLEEFFAAEKLQYAAQLESYGRMMRLAHGGEQELRLALYYPLLQRLLWWPG